MRILFALLLLQAVADVAATTTLAPGTYTVASCPVAPPPCAAPNTLVSGVCTPPVSIPPASGAVFVYQNGQFNWAGDYSFNATVNYKDTTGSPQRTYDLQVVTQQGGGGWQPFAQGKMFDTRPFSKLTYCVRPLSTNFVIGTGFAAINDVADGNIINIGAGSPYGPVPTAGVWGCYTIPLKDFGLTNPLIQKFTIATGVAATYFVDNVAFVP